jgi:3-methyladenine DNA glycosylase AlkC
MNKQKYNQYYIQSELASVTVIPSMIAASPFALLHDLSPPSAAFVRKISSKGAKIECLLDV